MKTLISVLLFGFLSFAGLGCARDHNLISSTRPFATLYGARKARWIDNNQANIFGGARQGEDFHEVEIRGFKKLDIENQKMYLVFRFCTHQGANAEDGSQMWRLLSALKCPKSEIYSYMMSQDKKAIELYAPYLRGSSRQFYANVRYYTHHL